MCSLYWRSPNLVQKTKSIFVLHTTHRHRVSDGGGVHRLPLAMLKRKMVHVVWVMLLCAQYALNETPRDPVTAGASTSVMIRLNPGGRVRCTLSTQNVGPQACSVALCSQMTPPISLRIIGAPLRPMCSVRLCFSVLSAFGSYQKISRLAPSLGNFLRSTDVEGRRRRLRFVLFSLANTYSS